MTWVRRAPEPIRRDVAAGGNVASGNVYVSRIGNVIELVLNGVVLADPLNQTIVVLPVGFRPQASVIRIGSLDMSQAQPAARLITQFNGTVQVLGHSQPLGKLYGALTWVTKDKSPAVLPGVAA